MSSIYLRSCRRILVFFTVLAFGCISWGICSKPLIIHWSVTVDHLVSKRGGTTVTVSILDSAYPHIRLRVKVKANTNVVDGYKSEVMVKGVPSHCLNIPEFKALELRLPISFARPRGEYELSFELVDPSGQVVAHEGKYFIVEGDVVYGGMDDGDCIGLKCFQLLGFHPDRMDYSESVQKNSRSAVNKLRGKERKYI